MVLYLNTLKKGDASMNAPVQMLVGSATVEVKTTLRGYQELIPTPGIFIQTTQTASIVALFDAECRMESNVGCLQVRITVDGAVADPGDIVMTSNINYETHTCLAHKNQVPPGTHAVTVQWRVPTGGTGYVKNRTLSVWEVH
jgi:hypothetical protein